MTEKKVKDLTPELEAAEAKVKELEELLSQIAKKAKMDRDVGDSLFNLLRRHKAYLRRHYG